MNKAFYSSLAWVVVAVCTLLSGCTDGMNLPSASTSGLTSPTLSKNEEITATPIRTPTREMQNSLRQTPLFRLPDTGQVKDYTLVFGEDSDFILYPPDYKDNGDGTVTDRVTGLVWQQSDSGEMTFTNAALYCQKLNLAGYDDWHLPNSQELFSILDHDRNPALDPKYFASTGAEYWWTGTEAANDPSKAWVVNAGGGIGAHPKNETVSAGGSKRFHTRCVRNATGNLPHHYSDSLDGTVIDLVTGLVWQQGETNSDTSWEAALKTCEALSLGGRDDWRLPNIKELQSLSDEARSKPSIDIGYFPSARSGRYWSSTTLFGRISSAWFIDFTSGLASYDDKSKQLSVRCVRGG